MNNLFIVHTQYNLILACGLVKTKFQTENNELIIFKDFIVKEELLQKLEGIFSKVTLITGNVPPRQENALQRLRYFKTCNKTIKKALDKPLTRIFIVDDMCIPEMYALKCAAKKNKNVEMIWLEDGANAYFSNGVVSGGMGGSALKRWIRKVFFGTFFGLGKYYDLGVCMGAHKLLSQAYLTFPLQVRRELSGKQCVEITDEAFCEGVRLIYGGEPISFEEKGLLIVMDKLDVYGEGLLSINDSILTQVQNALADGRKVYYKYHPRETDRLPALEEGIELDKTVGLESYLARSTSKAITVLGIKSTGLQTAKKLGYKTVSLIKKFEEENSPIVSFYQQINIELLNI